jgi:bacteriocin biosynthesis cyclodehydratase domain-containing protein
MGHDAPRNLEDLHATRSHHRGEGLRRKSGVRADGHPPGREAPVGVGVGLDPEALLWVPPATFVSAIDRDQVVLWTGGVRQVVRGGSTRLVSILLERARTGSAAGELVATVAAEDRCSEEEVWGVVECLFDRGILDHRDPQDDREADPGRTSDELAAQDRYLSLFTSHPSRARAALFGATIDVQAPTGFGPLVRARLRASGVGAVRLWAPDDEVSAPVGLGGDGSPSPAVLAGPTLEEEWMLARNLEWVEQGRPFLAVTLPSGTARVGPFVIPRESACLRCVAEAERRLRPALPSGVILPTERPPATDLAALLDVVVAIIALEVVKAVTGLFIPALANRRLFVEPSSLTFANEEVFKLPRCPACGRATHHVETEPFEMTSPPWAGPLAPEA